MPAPNGTETDFELTPLERLKALKYRHVFGMDLEPPHRDVVLKDVLHDSLTKRSTDLPPESIEEAVSIISCPQGADVLRRNIAFHLIIMRGFDLKAEFSGSRVEPFNLNGEEMAMYDDVASTFLTLYGQALLRDLMHDVGGTLKKNLKVDWNEPHRDDVKSAIRAAVKRALRKRKIREEDFAPLLDSILVQAQELYADWSLRVKAGNSD